MNRYQGISTLSNSLIKPKKRFFSCVKYPKIPLSVSDIYVITQDSDRYDMLANNYYKDKSLWWIILTANPFLPQSSLYPPIGVQIRIPINITQIISSFNTLNNV